MTEQIQTAVSSIDKKSQTATTISIIGFSLFILTAFAFHFIQPGLHPLKRTVSEYVIGRLGWIVNIAFFCFATGLFSLAFAFNKALVSPAHSRAGVVLLIFSATGILGAGVFNTHLLGEQPTTAGIIHAISSFLAFLTMIPAMFVFSRRLRLTNNLKGKYKTLRYLPWLAALLMLSMFFVFEPINLIGLGQRLFLSAVFFWLILAARGIQTGAIVTGKETKESDHYQDVNAFG